MLPHTIVIAIMLIGVLGAGLTACHGAPATREAGPADIEASLARRNKRVVTFVGYSGSGYEDEAAMLAHAGRVLDELDPADTIVSIGGTASGIGAVYEIARARGFATIGIVSTLARDEGAELSPYVDEVFFVPDTTWGGVDETTGRLSPTSTAVVETSDVIIGIGGGAVGRDELLAAGQRGKEVRFLPADMSHEKARAKARAKGRPEPTSFEGEAATAFAG